MVHVFKYRNRIVRSYLCYSLAGVQKVGRATHRYDSGKCGFQLSGYLFAGGIYTGPLAACIRCHRHLWWAEGKGRCPNCARKLDPITFPLPAYNFPPLPPQIVQQALRTAA